VPLHLTLPSLQKVPHVHFVPNSRTALKVENVCKRAFVKKFVGWGFFFDISIAMEKHLWRLIDSLNMHLLIIRMKRFELSYSCGKYGRRVFSTAAVMSHVAAGNGDD